MTDKALQVWRRSAARVTLHSAWPVSIELDVTPLRGMGVALRCIVNTYNASDVLEHDPLVSWEDLPMTNIMFEQLAPDMYSLDTPECEFFRLQYIRTRLLETALHELDEFLLVDGHVAASPHDVRRLAYDEVSTWQASAARVSLHPAFRLHVILAVQEDVRGGPLLGCAVRHSNPDLAVTVSYKASAYENANHVQQLLRIVRYTVTRLLDECLCIDGIPALQPPPH